MFRTKNNISTASAFSDFWSEYYRINFHYYRAKSPDKSEKEIDDECGAESFQEAAFAMWDFLEELAERNEFKILTTSNSTLTLERYVLNRDRIPNDLSAGHYLDINIGTLGSGDAPLGEDQCKWNRKVRQEMGIFFGSPTMVPEGRCKTKLEKIAKAGDLPRPDHESLADKIIEIWKNNPSLNKRTLLSRVGERTPNTNEAKLIWQIAIEKKPDLSNPGRKSVA